MENAADALKMAAAFLIFVLSLSITINAFGEARRTSQLLLDYNDREYNYSYIQDNGTTQRVVSAETIVPSIYKAYKENFKIVFKFKNGKELYKKRDGQEVKSIDLEKDILGNDEEKNDYIKALLYGKNSDTWDRFRERYKNIITQESIDNLHNNGLYGIIGSSRFKEFLGIYYQEEISGSSSESPDANKTEKRVITYEEI